MEVIPPVIPADDELEPESESLPIAIRKLDRLETTRYSNSQGA
jgi:hypothetical protein